MGQTSAPARSECRPFRCRPPTEPARAVVGATDRAGLAADRRGSAVVDFAILGPALVFLLIAILEAAMLLLSQFLLQTAVGDAARIGITGIEEAGLSRLELVRRAAERVGGTLLNPDRLALETLVYPSFESIGRPEPFTDVNGNGRHDPGEPFTDVNGNGSWDTDMGASGPGGPDAIVLYRVRYQWRPMTALLRALLPGGGLELRASYAVRNEPFSGG